MKKIIMLCTLTLLFFLPGCEGEIVDDSGGYDGTYSGENDNNDTEIGEEQAEEGNETNFFFFTYDDSASTAAVELVKYRLNNGILPETNLARPWEFFNYEEFDASGAEDYGIFHLAMGLSIRDRITDGKSNGQKEYLFGAYCGSDTITKDERDNVVLTLIVDVSGSMDSETISVEETRTTLLELVKEGLLYMEDSLKAGDIINIVTFSSSAFTVASALTWPEDRLLYEEEIESLTTLDSTNLNDGIARGYEMAQETFDPEKMNRIVILTDAYANTGEVDPKVISEHTVINGKEGIFFSGIGIGDGFNEQFLNELTDTGKGAYFTMITRNDARRIFEDRFIALSMVAARDVRFKLEYPASLTHQSGAAEEVSQDETDIQPTNFSYNTSQYFFETFIAEGNEPSDTEEFTLTIIYRDPETGTDKEVSLNMSIEQLSSLQAGNIRDAEAVFLLNMYLGGQSTYDEVTAVLDTHHAQSDSPLFNEYAGYIEKLHALRE